MDISSFFDRLVTHCRRLRRRIDERNYPVFSDEDGDDVYLFEKSISGPWNPHLIKSIRLWVNRNGQRRLDWWSWNINVNYKAELGWDPTLEEIAEFLELDLQLVEKLAEECADEILHYNSSENGKVSDGP